MKIIGATHDAAKMDLRRRMINQVYRDLYAGYLDEEYIARLLISFYKVILSVS